MKLKSTTLLHEYRPESPTCGFTDVRLNSDGRYQCGVCKRVMPEGFREYVRAACGEPMVAQLDRQSRQP